NINQTVGEFLPQYKMWKDVPIKRLLNMTSNIPNYSEGKKFTNQLINHLNKVWTPEELLEYANPSAPIKPLSHVKYEYCNTNYILAGLIVEAVTKQPFEEAIHQRIINKYKFDNVFYSDKNFPKTVRDRLVTSYAYDPDKKRFLELNDMNMT